MENSKTVTIARTSNKGAARWEMKITNEDGESSSVYAEKKSHLLQVESEWKDSIKYTFSTDGMPMLVH